MCSQSSDDRTLEAGAEIVATVGEPWDFSSSAGDNRLLGVVRELSEPDEAPEWVICDVSEFSSGAARIDRVAIVERTRSDSSLIERLADGESVTGNVLFSADRQLDRDLLRQCLAQGQGLNFLVGTLRTRDARG